MTVNVSGLRRWLASGFREQPEEREGDTWRSLLGSGVFALNAGTVASRFEDYKRAGVEADDLTTLDKVANGFASTVPHMANAALELPMMRGTMALLQAIERDAWEGWLRSYWQALTAVAIPGELSTLARARQLYVPDMRTATDASTVRNVIRQANPLINWDEAYPYKVDPLGGNVLRTPAGAPWHLYHLLDAGKPAQEVPNGEAWREVRKVFDASQNARAIPGHPERYLAQPVTSGPKLGKSVRVPIDPDEYNELLRYVGQHRMTIYRALVQSSEYQKQHPDMKAKLLGAAWERGLEIGKAVWYKDQRERGAAVVKRLQEALNREQTPNDVTL